MRRTFARRPGSLTPLAGFRPSSWLTTAHCNAEDRYPNRVWIVWGAYRLVSFIHSTQACTSVCLSAPIVFFALKYGAMAWLSMLRYCRTLEFSSPRVVAHRAKSRVMVSPACSASM